MGTTPDGTGSRARSSALTRKTIVDAARLLITSPGGTSPSVGAIAREAGVSRLTVYHHFGSRAGLFDAIASTTGAPRPDAAGEYLEEPPVDQLRRCIAEACKRWAADALLFRRLAVATEAGTRDRDSELVMRLAASDRLRAGCSLKEAEDVIGVVTSFAAFDRLHQDGRRSTAAVAGILMRMAAAILAP